MKHSMPQGIPREDVFDAAEFARRRSSVRAAMAARGVDTLLVHSPSNIYYLCGHHTLNIWDYQCFVLPAREQPFMVLWQFERGRFAASAVDADVHLFDSHADPVAATIHALADHGLLTGTVGLEGGSGFLTPQRYAEIARKIEPASAVDISFLVEDIRAVKSSAELALIRKASQLTDAATSAGLAAIKVGARDSDIAVAVASSLIAAGSEAFAIFPNIAVGYRSGMPHNSSAGVAVKRGDTVFIECSPALHWYNAPLMRTAVVGDPSDSFVQKVADAGAAALDAMCAAMRPGATSGDVAEAGSRALRAIRGQVLFHEYFGYSVGIGFPPTWIEGGTSNLIVGNTFPLVSGMAFHLPMTLRVMGKFGVGQSRTVIVGENGAEILTKFPAGLHRIAA